MPTHPPSPLSVKTIFRASADEMIALSDIALSLQTLTQRCIVSGQALSPADASILQSLDYLTQSLNALGGFFEGAAEEAEPEWAMKQFQALEVMTLMGLKNSLSNITAEPERASLTGSYELFD